MSPGSPRRALSVGAALLALLAVVAVASRGRVAGSGGGETRHIQADLVLEYVLLVLALCALVAVPLLAIGYIKAKDDPSVLPARGNWMRSVFLTMAVAAVAISGFMAYKLLTGSDSDQAGVAHNGRKPTLPTTEPREARVVDFDWVPVIVVLSIALAGTAVGGAYYLRARRRRPREAAVALALGLALDESLDDLRAEPDARKAVIAAYARMERALGASGLPRRAAEAPLEYLARVLRELLRASAESVSRLTALFERAKFSAHEIGPDLKEEAIDALVAVRDELRAYS
jgi:hypothetical protein